MTRGNKLPKRYGQVPKSTAATLSSAPSSVGPPTTTSTATTSTIAGRSGALKPPDNCQPTFNALPTLSTATIPAVTPPSSAHSHSNHSNNFKNFITHQNSSIYNNNNHNLTKHQEQPAQLQQQLNN
uniref:Uncharacterized protein n=1 Tax=Glossina palpalis gambiensis TaxID=67801 RepID=A0A1B0C6D5_9MUSC